MASRVAMVTGASRGIGKATALALAGAGYDVAVTARTVHEGDGVDDSDAPFPGQRRKRRFLWRRSAEPPPPQQRRLPGSLDTTAAGVEAAGARALVVPMDLHDQSTLTTAVDGVVGEWGRIDLLVNNAVDTGPGSMTRFLDTPLSAFAAKLDANALAPVALIKLVVPGMLERGAGTIVNVTSAVAVTDPAVPTGEGGWGAAYAMSKGAFHRLAAILAVELGERGLLVFNVEPGYVVTEKMEVNQRALGLEGRYPGAPPTVPAAVIAWLATDPGAAELNGQTISVQRFARERDLHPRWRR